MKKYATRAPYMGLYLNENAYLFKLQCYSGFDRPILGWHPFHRSNVSRADMVGKHEKTFYVGLVNLP